MKCPKCGKESESAFCPECGTPLQDASQGTENISSKPQQSYQMAQPPEKEKKKGGCLKIVLIVLAVFIALVIIGSMFGSDDTDSNDDSNTSTTSETVNSETTDDKKTETTPDADNKESEQQEEYISVGSSFEADNLKITVNEADTNFTSYDDEYGLYTPKDGMKYVMVSFTFENIGDSSDEYVSIYDFDCYADNTNCEQEYLPDDNDFTNTNLSSGRNVSFKTYYSVPVDAQSIELEYTENVWTDKKVLIKIQ